MGISKAFGEKSGVSYSKEYSKERKEVKGGELLEFHETEEKPIAIFLFNRFSGRARNFAKVFCNLS